LERSSANRTISTLSLERHHMTDRHHKARKSRKTHRFGRDWQMHEAMTYFTKYKEWLTFPAIQRL
jgi:IS1 family transposase